MPLLDGFVVRVLTKLKLSDALQISPTRKPDIVLIDAFGRWGVLGLLLSFLYGARLVVRLRGDYFAELKLKWQDRGSIYRKVRVWMSLSIAKWCLRHAAMVIANSQFLAKHVSVEVPKKRVTVVHNPYVAKFGTGPAEIQLPTRSMHLLSVTNFDFHPKAWPSIQVMLEWTPAELWEKYDLHWAVCGSGALLEAARRRVYESPIRHRISILGRVSDMPTLYRWADVLVHFTKMDAFPNVTMEAMMLERPIVTNRDSCGVREQVFHGVNGLVVDNIEQWIFSLHTYATNSTLRQTHGAAGRALVEERFTVSAQTKEMRAAIHSLVQ